MRILKQIPAVRPPEIVEPRRIQQQHIQKIPVKVRLKSNIIRFMSPILPIPVQLG